MNKTFQISIDQDGFARLPIRVQGHKRKTVKLIGIVDTASSYTIILPFACQLLQLPLFNKQRPEITLVTGSGYTKAPLKKATKIEVINTKIQKRNIAVVCHAIPKGVTILGHTFLKNYKATFDWKQKTFTLKG